MIALIDYDMGNLRSVAKAVEAAGGEVKLINSGAELSRTAFDKCILPGVGNFIEGMAHLESCGFVPAIWDFVNSGGGLLGICLGMQMLLASSEEAPGQPGLGLLKGRCVKFTAPGLKVPHIGWNTVENLVTEPLLQKITPGGGFYFVHSYYAQMDDPAEVWGTTEYGVRFASIIGRGRVAGTQFHPEKSQQLGLQLWHNFLERF